MALLCIITEEGFLEEEVSHRLSLIRRFGCNAFFIKSSNITKVLA